MYESTYYGSTSNIFTDFLVAMQIYVIIMGILGIFLLVCMWRIFAKAGKKGWYALIPVYNIIVFLEIVDLPVWYILLFFIPLVNIYVVFKLYISLAKKFGQSTGFGVACVFFPIIFLPILAFGKNGYQSEDFSSNSNQESYEQTFSSQPVSPMQDTLPSNLNQEINQENKKYCPNCGNPVNESATGCFLCGHQF